MTHEESLKDWSGDTHSMFVTLGSSCHTNFDRERDDYYATHPKAAEMLCDLLQFSHSVWEPACGGGHLAKVLQSRGYDVKATDFVYRGFGSGGVDFFNCQDRFDGDIITNPPYKVATEFVEHALDLVTDGRMVAMFLKLTFLEGKRRQALFAKHPPKWVYVSVSRLPCALGGDFDSMNGSAACYAWFVWEKGFSGDPSVRWFNYHGVRDGLLRFGKGCGANGEPAR